MKNEKSDFFFFFGVEQIRVQHVQIRDMDNSFWGQFETPDEKSVFASGVKWEGGEGESSMNVDKL